ncbi:MAG TPA: hypothetical protein VHD83_19135 [Puia sp.]|nr:hypothetical protein [Puia sp.]
MLQLILAIFWAFACPNHTGAGTTPNPSGQVTTMDDTGGETGHIPPPPSQPSHP